MMKSQITLAVVVGMLCTNGLPAQQQWHPLGPGLNGPVHVIVPHGTDVYVGGAFTDAGGNPDADYLARWDGKEWYPWSKA